MSWTEWYIRKILNKDPDRVHRSIWNKAKKQIEALSPDKEREFRRDWSAYNNRELKKEIKKNEYPEPESRSILPDGEVMPKGITSMSDLDYYLSLSEKGRKDFLGEESKESFSQVPLFPRYSTLDVLRKYLKKMGLYER